MPILKVDQFGRVYQTGRDSEDGTGYSGHATPVSQGDVTLGSAYIKANKAHQEAVLKDARVRELENIEFKRQRELARGKAMANRVQAMNEEKLAQNEHYQQHLKKKAIQMGAMGCCEKTYNDPLVGNRLTANGQTGYAGMNRDQQAIHQHLSGMGASSAHRVTQAEVLNRSEHARKLQAATIKLKAEQERARLLSKRNK